MTEFRELTVIARADADRPTVVELYTIKAEAGAGKSVFLRRLAWESATEADALTLYLREDGILKYETLREVYRVSQQRQFLFVDNAAKHASELAYTISSAIRDRLPLTVITTERINAWNMACEKVAPFVTEYFDLRYLSHSEITALVKLLAATDSLGPNLTGRTIEECVLQFEEHAGRQLLVALHEATFGLPFEEILLHEYHQIEPNKARQLYLTVCVLNRLNVEVRAGLIARVHGIPFESFKEQLFAPLEHVVQVREQTGTRDYLYSARHQEIAQIVFDRVLTNKTDRFNEYVRIIAQLNLSYTTDRTAFRGMVRAKSLHDLFPDYEDVRAVFDAAETIAQEDAYLLQQRANYERIRPSGNILEAERYLARAREVDPRDMSILHTLAEIKRARAEAATHQLEKEKYRNEARAIVQPLLGDQQHGRYGRVTLIKLALDDLRDVLNRPSASDSEIDAAIRAVEDPLQRSQQQYPDEQYVLTAGECLKSS